jgi:hypothetical protein
MIRIRGRVCCRILASSVDVELMLVASVGGVHGSAFLATRRRVLLLTQ